MNNFVYYFLLYKYLYTTNSFILKSVYSMDCQISINKHISRFKSDKFEESRTYDISRL